MFELLLKTPEGIEADEFKPDEIKITLVPVSADKAAADDRYSKEMRPQFVELICSNMSEIFPKPKRKRRCVKKRPPVARHILPAMSRQREHRAAPRRDGGTRADRSASADDGGGGSDPPPRRKSECGPRAEVQFSSPRSRAPRVLNDGRAPR